MVKSYLKFEQSKTFGQICSPTSNCVWDPRTDQDISSKTGAGTAFVGANAEVLRWDLKRGELEGRWSVTDSKVQVTCISRSQRDPDIFAVGYDDGKIRIWLLSTGTIYTTFNGHKSAITHLQFDRTGARLASGSRDTDIILWDLTEEVGLFKLRGHKDQITSLNFLSPEIYDETQPQSDDEPDQFLLSTSKDALVKIWDLSTRHCIETQVAQTNGECWALGLSPTHDACITAGNDGEIKAWSIDKVALDSAAKDLAHTNKILKDRGTFYRNGKDRTIAVKFHPKRDLIALHGSEKAVELWKIRSEGEIRKSLNRKRKRKREKLGEDAPDEDAEEVDMSKVLVTELIVPHLVLRTGGKVRSIDWAGGKSSKSFSLLIATSNNQLEVYDVSAKEKESEHQPDYNRTLSVDMPGHRSDIRCLALSSDDRMLASASQGSLKIWNTRTQTCLRTLDCDYALCATFLPGDKIVVLGTREGKLQIFDIASSSLLDTIDAHERDIWSLHVNPDGRSIVTGSADKSAKFWDLKVVQEEVLGTTRKTPKLTLVHTRTLKTTDDILAVRFSPDGKYLALSTLDTTVKVFFTDSLKLYLTLYGHKLPVLSLDISYDSKLVVTSSADKTVRVWGLDFGDCHKTFFAHNDSILTVAFVPNNNDGNGHHFFSASKDRVIKYYDGDKFEQIQKLEGHHGEIWALAVAHSGEFIASASHDKSIRLWQQTDEQVFLEEEREKELEEMYEDTLLTSLENDDNNPDGNDAEAVDATKQSAETLIASERIIEALMLGMEDLELMREHELVQARNPNKKLPPPQDRHPIFTAGPQGEISASKYLLTVLQKVPAAALQDALLLLPFAQLPALFTFLAIFATVHASTAVPLTCKILNFMLKAHHRQIVSSKLMRKELEELKEKLRKTLEQNRREVGFNLAGLRVVGRRIGELGETELYVDGEEDGEEQQKSVAGKKRTFVNVA